MIGLPLTNQVDLHVGFFSAQGKRQRNEDYCGVWTGTVGERARHGAVAVLADGVGGAKGGRVAAELAVHSFIDGYLGLPETLGVQRAAARSAEAINRWLFEQGKVDPALDGMATTLTALILRGRRAHIVHAGDSRLYRVRDGQIAQLTTDHTFDRPDMAHILKRALGAEESIRIDYRAEPIRLDDRFLLCSDGVHGVLRDRQILDALAGRGAPEAAARAVVDAALSAGSNDNATALVVDILGLPATAHSELSDAIARLPIMTPPNIGEMIDRYRLVEQLSDGRYTRLFKAIDQADERPVIIKFPKPGAAQELSFRLAFLREIWIPSRIRSPWVGEVIELPPDRQTRLYAVMPYYSGETLEMRLSRKPKLSIQQGLPIAIKLAKAVAALHRAGIVHRDIKPENIIVQDDEGLRLIDLGVAHLPRVDDFPSADIPGTPSYMAPELFAGKQSDERSDLFALGVTLYRMFSGGAYPYGEVEPFSRPRFGRPMPLGRLRPDLPVWLESIVQRAIAITPDDRHSDAVELVFDLEDGFARGSQPLHRPLPLYTRDPLMVWQVAAVLLAILLLTELAELTMVVIASETKQGFFTTEAQRHGENNLVFLCASVSLW